MRADDAAGDPAPGGLPAPAELEARVRRALCAWGLAEAVGAFRVVWNPQLGEVFALTWCRARRVELNPRLLARHPARLDAVLVHEAAHLASVAVHGEGVDAHGVEWAELVEALGFAADVDVVLPADRAGSDENA